MLSKMSGGSMEFISRPTPSSSSAAGGRRLVTEMNVVRFVRDDVLCELARNDFLGARKRQSLPEVSLSISSWFSVAFAWFAVPVLVLRMIFSATRVGAADCDFALHCRQDRLS
jgi:hypothetical protein